MAHTVTAATLSKLNFGRSAFSGDALQPPLSHQNEQLERGATGRSFAALPLADHNRADIQMPRENRLAGVRLFPDGLDLGGRQLLHRRETQFVKRETQFVK